MHADTRAYNEKLEPDVRKICDRLAREIDRGLKEAENKVWHAHPVWFLDGNPVVGYSKLKEDSRDSRPQAVNRLALNCYYAVARSRRMSPAFIVKTGVPRPCILQRRNCFQTTISAHCSGCAKGPCVATFNSPVACILRQSPPAADVAYGSHLSIPFDPFCIPSDRRGLVCTRTSC